MTEKSDRFTENEEKKEYLNGYKKSCIKLRSLEEQMQSMREVKESAKIQSITDMPQGNKQSDLSDYIVQLDVLFTKIIKMKSECMRKRIEIEEMIADLPDGVECLILHKKYIEFKKWEVICVEIGYEWAQTHRKHSDALQHINMIHNDTLQYDNIRA